MLEKSSKHILLTGGLMVIYHGTIVQSVKNHLKQIQVKALRCRSVTIPEILIDSFVLGILLSWLFTIKNNHS